MEDVGIHLDRLLNIFQDISTQNFTQEKIKSIVMPYAEEKGRGEVLWPLRVALSGKKASSGPFEIAAVLGKEKTIARIKEALKKLGF